MKSDELLQFYTLQTPREVQYIPGWILDLENTLFPYKKDIVASWKIIAKRYRLDNETAPALSGFCTLVIESTFLVNGHHVCSLHGIKESTQLKCSHLG